MQHWETQPRHDDGRFGCRMHSAPEAAALPVPLKLGDYPQQFREVLASAAKLQQLVPQAVMVGGSAASIWARHRLSTDHDHVVPHLDAIYQDVLSSLEHDPGWSPARNREPVLILGSLNGVDAGVRNLRRTVPLETVTVLVNGTPLVIPTAEETLRIKTFLAVTRNQVRDYLDIAALCDHLGVDHAAATIARIDDYYEPAMTGQPGVTLLGQAVGRLSALSPNDHRTITQLSEYKQLDRAYQHWQGIEDRIARLVDAIDGGSDGDL